MLVYSIVDCGVTITYNTSASIAGFERNWWSDCDECHLDSFLVSYTREDSFIIGAACGKKWGGLET